MKKKYERAEQAEFVEIEKLERKKKLCGKMEMLGITMSNRT